MKKILISNQLDEFYSSENPFKKKKINNEEELEELEELEDMEELEELEDMEELEFANEFDNFDKYYELIDNINEDKKVDKETNNTLSCNSCNSDSIVEDTTHGIIVCKNCGQVLSTLIDLKSDYIQYNDDNRRDNNRSSHSISQLLPQSSTATTIAGNCSSRIKTLHGWSAMPYKERSLNEVFKIIALKCQQGKILKCIEDDAKIMYKNISDCKHLTGKNKGKSIIIRGRNRISVIASCILFACKKKNKTRSPKEIGELFDLKYTEITKGCKIFKKLAKLKKMELKVSFTKPEHFITRFCEELKIKDIYTKQAIQISHNIAKLQIASVHTPLSLATGSIYLMICLNKLNIQKKTIAEKFNVSQVTIAKATKKIEPFINILINDSICDRLSIEIKKYQDDIHITDILKPKFIRFNIDVKEVLDMEYKDIYSIIGENNMINEKLLVEQDIELDNKSKQIENEYLRIKLTSVDDIYQEIMAHNKIV
jgi:transcription initiation factor TFIIIB Brf1 subunit/transcription initiation factor TFIIB